MARESDGYRAALEDIIAYFRGKRMLSGQDVAAYLGIDARTAKKRYGIGKDGIFATELARMLTR